MGYFTGLIPKFLDPYFGVTPSHEIAVEVVDQKTGRGINGAEVSISELGVDNDGSGILDSELLNNGDAKLLADTSSKSGRLRVNYEVDGTTYRYRKVLDFADSTTVSLQFPKDFSYDGKGNEPPGTFAGFTLIPPTESKVAPNANEAVAKQKESLDNAIGEAALGLDDVTRQMKEAREAREAKATNGQ